MDIIHLALAALAGAIGGGSIIWRIGKLKPKSRADALKVIHALYLEAMKLPGAAEAKSEADTLAVLEKHVAEQFAATVAKVIGGS